jgi:chemotaxis protein CheY-P-specific phosphatase CheC
LGKVAEYQRAIEIIADPKRRAAFDRLRSMWIALGNELSSFDELQLSTIAQIHAQLMSAYANAMH